MTVFFADTPQYMTVNKNSEHVEEAVDFLNYFYNNTEAQETLKDVRSFLPHPRQDSCVRIRDS